MRILFLILFLILGLSNVEASIKLNISILYKKGVSKELVLSNELHVTEITENGRPVTLSMSNGLQYIFTPFFYNGGWETGPTSIINIEGKIVGANGKAIKLLEDPGSSNGTFLIQLGHQKKYIFNDRQEQEIEITITPTILK